MSKRPIAVVISDVHFNMFTLSLASASLRAAVLKAEELSAPLIIAGDLHDTKALLNGKCVKTILDILRNVTVSVYVLVGNHDKLNERSEEHSLEFLRPYACVVDSPIHIPGVAYLIPYQHDTEVLKNILANAKLNCHQRLIMHQGVIGGSMGEYVTDKTSLSPNDYKGFRVISGHYHRHQFVQIPEGSWEYIGTPYTVTAAEAEDGPKGFQIINSDFSMTQVPLTLRKHVTVERTVTTVLDPIPELKPDDILWLKVTGSYSELELLNKKQIGLKHLGHQNFKLDPVYTDGPKADEMDIGSLKAEELIDLMIDEAEEPKTEKAALKKLWREVYGAT